MNSKNLISIGCLSAFAFASSCAAFQIAQDVQQGRNALHSGQPATAVSYLRRAADRDPNYHAPDPLGESVLTYLGRAHYEMGNFSEARSRERTQGNSRYIGKPSQQPVPGNFLGQRKTHPVRNPKSTGREAGIGRTREGD